MCHKRDSTLNAFLAFFKATNKTLNQFRLFVFARLIALRHSSLLERLCSGLADISVGGLRQIYVWFFPPKSETADRVMIKYFPHDWTAAHSRKRRPTSDVGCCPCAAAATHSSRESKVVRQKEQKTRLGRNPGSVACASGSATAGSCVPCEAL